MTPLTYVIFYPTAPRARTAARDYSAKQSRTGPNNKSTTRETSGSRNRDGPSSKVLLDSMEGNYPGSLGSGSGEGLPVKTGTSPLPGEPSSIGSQIPNRTQGNGSRSSRTPGQGCSEKGSLAKQSIHQHAVCSPQKGWIFASSDQPETPQFTHGQPTFQNGGNPQSEGIAEGRGLDVLGRSKGCLPLSSHCRESQEIPSVHMVRHHLRIHLTAIWSLQCTEVLHKTPSPGDGSLMIQRSEVSSLLRRYLADGRRSGDSAGTSPSDHNPSGTTGLHREQVEVNPGPLPSDHLLGSAGGHNVNEVALTSGKNATNHEQLQADIDKGNHYSTGIGSCNRKDVSSSPGSVTSSPSHSPPPASVNSNTKEIPSLRSKMILSQESLKEVQWWIHHLHEWNGRDITRPPPDLITQSDASLQGWGAVSNGTRTGGPWSGQERTLHINSLELLAGSFAIKAYTKHRNNIHVLLQMDNSTAVPYMNKMGGTRSLSLSLQACHL